MRLVRLAGIVALALALTALGSAPASTSPALARLTGVASQPSPPQFRIVGCRASGGEYSSGSRAREVAIGFDDGPWYDTPQFVSTLERLRANATFFMIGEQITSGYRSTLLRELRAGDVLGDHTWTHPDLVTYGHVTWQLAHTQARIRELTGYKPCLFRPPYGAIDSSVVDAARRLGMASILWDVDPVDWSRPGTRTIIDRVLSQVRPGSIILSHDGGGNRAQTLAAYQAIIPALRARGYRIVTIPQLLGFRPVYRSCSHAACDGLGIAGNELPANAIVTGGPTAKIAAP